VLGWLLEEPGFERIIESLAEADTVVASDLTLVETERTLIRGVATGRFVEAEAADRRRELGRIAQHWMLVRLVDEVADRAKRPFVGEPIKTLDALHLSYAMFARSLVPGIRMLSFDERIRTAAVELGFELLPA